MQEVTNSNMRAAIFVFLNCLSVNSNLTKNLEFNFILAYKSFLFQNISNLLKIFVKVEKYCIFIKEINIFQLQVEDRSNFFLYQQFDRDNLQILSQFLVNLIFEFLRIQIIQLFQGSDSQMFKKSYELLCEFNRGQYGVAHKVRSRQDNQIYIAKTICLTNFTQPQKKKALIELQIMKELKHPHIVGFRESFLENDELIIVLEFCEFGDLAQLIKKRRESGQRFSENLILNWMLQLVMALEYVHKRKILHRDIKAANVFLTSSAVIKLGDFGISKILSETVHSKTFVGTPYYMSPEMSLNQPYYSKSDIWSLGCVVYEVATLDYPFKGKNLIALLQNITACEPPEIPECYSDGLRQLVKKMLTKDHRKRPSASEILFDPLMVEILKDAMKNSQNLKKQLEVAVPTKHPKVAIDRKKVEQQERFIFQKMKEIQQQTKQKLKDLQEDTDNTHSLTLYEAQIQKKIQQLQHAVSEGFRKIKSERISGQKSSDNSTASSSMVKSQKGKTIVSKQLEESMNDKTIMSRNLGQSSVQDKTIMSRQLDDSLDDKTINSIMMGSMKKSSMGKSSLSDKTVNSILMDSKDKTLQSLEMSSRSKIVLDKTVGSIMCDTLQQGEISDLGLHTIKAENKSKSFKGSNTMKTIQSLQLSHAQSNTEPSRKQNQVLKQGLEEIQNKIGDLNILSEEISHDPTALFDESLLSYTLSMTNRAIPNLQFHNTLKKQSEDTLRFDLTSSRGKQVKQVEKPVKLPTEQSLAGTLTKSVEYIEPKEEELEEYYDEDFEEYEEELSRTMKKSSSTSPNKQEMMSKERQQIVDIYKQLLAEIEQPRNKYLVMSQIKEVANEGSTITSGGSSAFQMSPSKIKR